MKNFKKISVALLAVTSLTEITYPIVLTGPVRRNVQRSQKKEAYEAGLMNGQREKEYLENEQNYDIEDINQDQYEAQKNTLLAPEYEVFDENYADDGSVVIQARVSREIGVPNGSQLPSEIKKQIMERIGNNDGVTTQSIEGDDKIEEDGNEQAEETIEPKTEVVAVRQEVETPSAQARTITIPTEVLAEENNDNEKQESILIPAEFVAARAVAPVVEEVQEVKEVKIEPVAEIAIKPTVENIELQPAVITEPVTSQVNEQMKIVKFILFMKLLAWQYIT